MPFDDAKVTFKYNASTHVLTILCRLRSRITMSPGMDCGTTRAILLYRTPGGAVPAGSTVLIRFRTFHNDVTGVSLRVYDLERQLRKVSRQ